jgi:hypothetical protein
MQSRLLSLVVASTVSMVGLGVGACGGGEPDGPADANPFCAEATLHDDLPWLQENIFTPSCSRFGVCHQRDSQGRLPREAGHLTLEDGETFAQLVDVDSDLFPEYKRVVPGDPAASYLMIILGSEDGPLKETGTMPYQNPLLCQEERDAVARWITSLAPAPDAGVADAAPADAGPPDAGP